MSDTIKKVELGKVANVITKGTTPTSIGFDFTQTGINFIKIESISEEGNFIQSRIAHISEECNNKLKRSQLELNDILFSIAGAIGRVAKVTSDILPANTNQALALIRLKPGIFDYDFLCYYLQSQAIAEQYEKKKQGVAQLNISLNDISNFELPIMDFACQLKVVKYLNKVMHLIEKRKKQIEKLDELVRSRFVEMFGDPIRNEKGWVQATLKDIAVGKLSYGSGTSAIKYDGKIRYIRITDIMDNGELNDDIKSPNQVDEKYLLNEGDILFARSGATVGKTCCYKAKMGKAIYAGYLIRLIPNRKLVSPQYVYYYTKTGYYNMFIKNSQKVVAQPNINAQEYGDLVICVPPIELQNKFAEFVEKVEKTKSAIKKSLYSLETLKKSLMQKYFG